MKQIARTFLVVLIGGRMADLWIVIFTKPGAELPVRDWIEASGNEAFVPLCSEGKPLFPRYMFARDGPMEPIKIRWARGVIDLLRLPGSDGRFVRLAGEVVDVMRERDGEVLEEAPPPRFRKGDRVRVHGLIDARVRRMRPRDRVQVLIKMLGGVRKSVVHAEDLEPA